MQPKTVASAPYCVSSDSPRPIRCQLYLVYNITKQTLTQKYIDVTGEFGFKRREYAGKRSTAAETFRVVGGLAVDTDDYHLYVTNLSDKFMAEQVAALYNRRWKVELLFRELKSRYGLEKFEASDPAITELLVVSVLLTLVVSKGLLAVF